MTTQETAADLAARFLAALEQREIDARKWQRQAHEWEARCTELRERLAVTERHAVALAARAEAAEQRECSLHTELRRARSWAWAWKRDARAWRKENNLVVTSWQQAADTLLQEQDVLRARVDAAERHAAELAAALAVWEEGQAI